MARKRTDNFIRWIQLNDVVLQKVTGITLKVPMLNSGAITNWKKTHAPMFRYHNPDLHIKIKRTELPSKWHERLIVSTNDGKSHVIKPANDRTKEFGDAHHITRSILAIETGQPLADQLYGEDLAAKENSSEARQLCCVHGSLRQAEHVVAHKSYEGFFVCGEGSPCGSEATVGKGTGAAWAAKEASTEEVSTGK